MKADKILKLRDTLKVERANFNKLYDDVEDYVYPRLKSPNDGEVQGAPQGRKVYDSTPTIAVELLASSLNTTLTNPASRWFSVKVDEMSDSEANSLSDIMFSEINKEASRFQSNIYETWLESVVYGTCAIHVAWNDKKNCLIFQNIHCREIYVGENADGNIDTVIREFELTPHQLADYFGEENLTTAIRDKIKSGVGLSEKHKVVWYVGEDKNFHKYLKADKFPVQSIFVLESGEHILSTGGYRTMPIIAGRWTKVKNETYGRSPCINMLPDIKMLNFFMKEMIISAQLSNRPPMLVQDEEQIKLAPIVPNGVIPYSGQRPEPLILGNNVSQNFQVVEEIRNRIRKGMYNDLLMFSDKPVNMTATEYLKRTEENVKLMSPMVARLQCEVLSSLLTRVYSLLKQHGRFEDFGELPDDVKVEFTTISDMALRGEQVSNLARFLEMIMGYVQLDPQSVSVVDVDSVIRKLGDIMHVDDVLKDERDVKLIREEAQAQAMQQQATAQEAQAQQLQGMALNNQGMEKELNGR